MTKSEMVAARNVDPERLARRLLRSMLTTVTDHGLIREGDRILVAVSGGKDSYTMLELLARARSRSPVNYELTACHVDQMQPGYDGSEFEAWLRHLELPFEIIREDTYSAVMAHASDSGEKTYCRVCSRLRRGILYSTAQRLGCNKIALGHHRDDALETLLMNLFYSGRLQAMPPVYTTNDGRFEVIRPLIECGEREIAAHAQAAEYPIIPCNLCGSQDDLKRVEVARLLGELEERIPDIRQVMLAAIKNVRPSHLLDREVAQAWAAAASQYPPRR